MRKFQVVLVGTDISLSMVNVFEDDFVPAIGHSILIHDYPSPTYVKVCDVRRDLEKGAIEVVCPCTLDDLCLADLKTRGWELRFESLKKEELAIFKGRRSIWKGKVLTSTLI